MSLRGSGDKPSNLAIISAGAVGGVLDQVQSTLKQ